MCRCGGDLRGDVIRACRAARRVHVGGGDDESAPHNILVMPAWPSSSSGFDDPDGTNPAVGDMEEDVGRVVRASEVSLAVEGPRGTAVQKKWKGQRVCLPSDAAADLPLSNAGSRIW